MTAPKGRGWRRPWRGAGFAFAEWRLHPHRRRGGHMDGLAKGWISDMLNFAQSGPAGGMANASAHYLRTDGEQRFP
jgi:hypothetical protein